MTPEHRTVERDERKEENKSWMVGTNCHGSGNELLVDVAHRRALGIALRHGLVQLKENNNFNEILLSLQSSIRQVVATVDPQEFKTLTSAELDAADFHTTFLVEEVLARHQSTIIAAAKKSLKTNIAIDLTLSLASRCQFLGKFNVPAAVRVALMSGESGDATIQETARRIARSKSWLNLRDYENAVWSFELPRLGRPETRRDLAKFITDYRLDVLIVDPAYLCLDLSDDAGNLFSVGKKLRELTDIQHETGCTIIIIHHNKKSSGDPFAVPELDSIAWAGFQEWARQWMLIGRRESYNPERSGSHKLWFTVGGSAGHSGLWGLDIEEGCRSDEHGRRWEVSADGASKVIAEKISQKEAAKEQQSTAKKEKTLKADAEKMLKNYRLTPDGETLTFFRAKSRFSGDRASAANDLLLSQGLIEPCTVIKNKREYDGFKLVAGAAGLTGAKRDTTGTTFASPDELAEADNYPKGGCPRPTHRDIEDSLVEQGLNPVPVDDWGDVA